MKRFRLFVLLLFFTVLFSACNKKDDDAKPTPNPTVEDINQGKVGVMTAEVNGIPWKSATAFAAQVNTYGLTIMGQFNNESISVTTNAVIRPGKFDAFSYPLLNGIFALNHGSSTEVWTTLNNPVCQLTITKLDWAGQKISGTFAFEADSQGVAGVRGLKNVTNGVFTDLPLQTTTPLNFSLNAQVDNQPYVGSGMYFGGYWGSYSLEVSDVNGHAMHLTGIDLTKTGPQPTSSALYSVPSNNPYEYWSATQNNPATVTITQFDPINGTASGSFSFVAEPSMSGAATKTISQGTFTNVPVF